MVGEAFYQTNLERFSGDVTDFVFDIPTISDTNEYRLTVSRKIDFSATLIQIDGVKEVANKRVIFTPTAADVAQAKFETSNNRTYFVIQEMSGATPVAVVGDGVIDWGVAPA